MSDFQLNVNGALHHIKDISADTPLLWVLRDTLNLVGTKYGCGIAQCGACTVHIDGQAMRSCSLPIAAINKNDIITIEGLSTNDVMHPLQQAWIDHDVPQCGYCQAGQIMSAAALLAVNSSPTDDDIDLAMSGNLCRCATYKRIRAAIHSAAKVMTKTAQASVNKLHKEDSNQIEINQGVQS